MKKRKITTIVLIFIFIFTITLLSGCTEEGKIKNIQNYLNKKYEENFEFVSSDNNVLFSKIIRYEFKDKFEQKFLVESYNDDLSDNYYSTKYDALISKTINSKFENSYKVFVNSRSAFTSKKEIYFSMEDYLNSRNLFYITVYSYKIDDYEKIVDTIKSDFKNGTLSIEIMLVSKDNFENVTSTSTEVIESINNMNFQIENGNIIIKDSQ